MARVEKRAGLKKDNRRRRRKWTEMANQEEENGNEHETWAVNPLKVKIIPFGHKKGNPPKHTHTQFHSGFLAFAAM